MYGGTTMRMSNFEMIDFYNKYIFNVYKYNW